MGWRIRFSVTPEESLERMEALTRANLRLLKRVSELEERVATLEGKPKPVAEPLPELVAEPIPPLRPAPAPGLETKVGLAWVNRIAVVTCIFAAAFFFKYAADNEWIGPSGRVILGFLAGLVSIALGERFHRRDERTYAQGLCGLGASLLFLASYAAFGFYSLIPLGGAFLLMIVSIALAGSLAIRYHGRAIAALALLGGFLTPLLLSTGNFNALFFYLYLAILSGAACWLAQNRKWPLIELLALGGVFVLTVASLDDMDRTNAEGYLIAFLCAAFVIFASSPVASVFHAAQVVFPVLLFTAREGAAFVPALLAMTAASLWRGGTTGRRWTLPVAYIAATLCTFGWIEGLTSPLPLTRTMPLPAGLFLLFASWIPWRLRDGHAISNAELTATASNGVSFFAIVAATLDPHYKQWLGTAALLTAGVYALAGRLSAKSPRAALLNFGLALAFVTLAIPLQFEKFTITMAWAIEAAALAWIAARTGSLFTGYVSLCVFALCAFSLGWNPAEGGRRILSYLSVAAAMWFAAHSFKGVTIQPRLALIPYITGHLVIFAGLGQEIADWARRHSAPEDVASVASLGVSLLLALWAVGLVYAGVAFRSAVNRVFGLVLTAFIVAKLYLYDVWNLGVFYRVIAFAGLGGTLLLTSFLYSRYRSKIESLWQSENN